MSLIILFALIFVHLVKVPKIHEFVFDNPINTFCYCKEIALSEHLISWINFTTKPAIKFIQGKLMKSQHDFFFGNLHLDCHGQ